MAVSPGSPRAKERYDSATFVDNLDLALVVALQVAVMVILLSNPDWNSPLRTVFGLVLVLVFPGYVSTCLLFPRSRDLHPLERLSATLGLSIAAIPFFGLVLNFTPWGITLHSMMLALTGFVVFGAALSSWQRALTPPPDRFVLLKNTPQLRDSVILAVGFCLAFALPVYFTLLLRPHDLTTEFYVLGPEGRLEGYPLRLNSEDAVELTVGVRNFEGERASFEIRVPFQDAQHTRIETPALREGELWEETLSLFPAVGNNGAVVPLELYLSGEATPHRSLELSVTRSEGDRRGEGAWNIEEGGER